MNKQEQKKKRQWVVLRQLREALAAHELSNPDKPAKKAKPKND